MKLGRQPQRRRPASISGSVRGEPLKRTAISYRSLSAQTDYSTKPREMLDGRHNRNQANTTTLIGRLLHNLPTKLALFAIGGSLLYITTLNTQINLSAQTVSSTNGLLRARTAYQAAAQDILSQSIFNRSKLTVNVSGFERAMQDRFTELESVTLTIPLLGHEPVVGLIARKPVLKLATSQGVFLVDIDGRALLKVTEAINIDSLNLPLATDETQVEVAPGKSVITASATRYITELHSLLTQKQVVIQSMTLPATSEELRVTLKDRPYYVRFNIDTDPRQSAGEYIALQEEFTTGVTAPTEYIDLRVPERAFYK